MKVFSRVKQEKLVGAIVKIPINEQYHTYARIMNDPNMAFYDIRCEKDKDITDVVSSPIIFIIGVSAEDAIKKGLWEIVGALPLEPELQKQFMTYTRDVIDPDQYFLWRGNEMWPAKREDCIGLELTAIWYPEHVESRLRMHFLGEPFEWGDYMLPMKE